jgi:citrate lyase subunit beta/citryl-CoA lyase
MRGPKLKSFLIAPANRPDLVLKMPRCKPGICVIDLEDGTPPAEKESARAALPALVARLRGEGYAGLLGVRVNEPWSDLYLADIEAVAPLAINVLVVAKLESADQLFPAAHALRRAVRGDSRERSIMAGIESINGVTRAARLFAAYPEVRSMYWGAEDFMTDMGGLRTAGGGEIHVARSLALLYAKEAGLIAFDHPIADIRNDALFRADTEQGRQMGFDGKVCLLPRQVEIANQVYTPSAAEVDHARRLLCAYEEALGLGIGTIDFEGAHVDGPLLKRARQTLALAEG